MQRQIKKTTEIIDGSRLKIGIIVSNFHNDITAGLLLGALDILAKNTVKKANIKIVFVPGSFEIPYTCQRMAKTGIYDALIALGCIIRGQTDHYCYIASQTAQGIMEIGLKYNIPIGFGVITTNNLAQAKARSRGDENKGKEAALAALKLITIL